MYDLSNLPANDDVKNAICNAVDLVKSGEDSVIISARTGEIIASGREMNKNKKIRSCKDMIIEIRRFRGTLAQNDKRLKILIELNSDNSLNVYLAVDRDAIKIAPELI